MNFSKLGIKRTLRQMRSKGIKISNLFKVSFLQLLFIGMVTACILMLCVGIGAFNGILASSPEINEFDLIPTGYATLVYDCEGHEMTKLVSSNANRSYVTLDKIPQYLQDAVVAVEDERFYEHNGIDIKGIVRAGFDGIKNGGKFHQGASTITQQLLKNNVFDSSWVTETKDLNRFKRKIQEQYLAVEVEKKMDKKQILEYYLNTINLGQNTLGVQAASQRYFGKPVYQLTLSESAVLAGITQNPSKYNPIRNPEKNGEKRAVVLKKMYEQGYISKDEYAAALADDVYSRIQKINEVTGASNVNSYFVDELTDQVAEDLVNIAGYDQDNAYRLLYAGGLKIYSTQNPEIQAYCDEVFGNEENYAGKTKYLLSYQLTIDKANGDVVNHSSEMYEAHFKETNSNFNMIYASEEDALAAIEEYKAAVMEEGDEERAENIVLTPQPQASITVMDQSNGYVLAMVGGRGEKIASKTLNRATNTMRQPGSLFKVLSTYAPALDSCGFTLANVQYDGPFTYTNGRPISNWYGQAYRGICSLRLGIIQSLNIVTVKVLTQITPQMGFDYLLKFGFTTLVDREVTKDGQVMTDVTQALALGGITHGVTNMETNAAFASIANNGIYNRPLLYSKVTDADGNIILDSSMNETHKVIEETTAYLLTSAMEDCVLKGTGAEVNFGNMAIAAKTGTTSSYNDIWLSGYTPYYTATVWVGFDNNVDLANDQHKIAKHLWRECMSRIHSNLPYASFDMPNGITKCAVCSLSGKLPNEGLCNDCIRTEIFAEGTEPFERCDIHYKGIVCGYDGKIACDTCPFQVEGIATLPLREDPCLDYGQNSVPNNYCMHNSSFFAQPNFQEILNQQMWEMQNR
ncbi:MAG: transglycosylase domain-containing protein [Lachnospiraceae bacterium]|nr:transglycosylase domain-containing protein [Lachnospiraceae bacterium]